MKKILCVCGARPNFMKISPLLKSLHESGQFSSYLVHTGQHYDDTMSNAFFDDLDLPRPDVNLNVGPASQAVQTAEIMKRFEPCLLDYRPDAVLVVGDVNSTLACGLVAVKLGVELIHVEAGLRSFDLSMPEEVNRVLTDHISGRLFVTEPVGVTNLIHEGIDPSKIHLVGNVMIDCLKANLEKIHRSTILDRLVLSPGQYSLVTLHRPANVDNRAQMEGIIDALAGIQKKHPLLFSVHPRTLKNLTRNGLLERLQSLPQLKLVEPLGYLDFLKLIAHAFSVITDSGGMQAETTFLQTPCLTLRPVTEQPVTITHGTNRLTPPTTDGILTAFDRLCDAPLPKHDLPEIWDGNAAARIVEILSRTD